MFSVIRRLLFGLPLPTWRQKHERLNKFLALPVFASDAVSSVAYGPEEILIVLVVAGAIAWKLSLPVAICIAALVVIVTMSYRQTIYAYPRGGGSYIVARENLGTYWGLIAAAAILSDYVLTVAVSVASGVLAIISAYPQLGPHRVELGVLCVAFVALANLRGIRESGTLFAPPTYIFIVSLFVLCGVGLFKLAMGTPVNYIIPPSQEIPVKAGISLFLILRAFSGGCSSLTGLEAVADGTPAFKPPESKNAAATMTYMAAILALLVLGITYLAHVYRILPAEHETVVSQIARAIFGRNRFYFLIQYSTAAILILAANTAYQDFPRLSSILARDRFAPRQLANLGDRLVFANGITLLGLTAMLLIIIFRGDVHLLIPLYAVGVFVAFTLSQSGMCIRIRRLKEPGWQIRSAVSGFGAFVTGVVVVVAAVTKFKQGAYIVCLLIPTLVFIFYKIHQHYLTLADQLRVVDGRFHEPPPVKSTTIVLVGMIHKGILPALEYAKTLSHDCRALYVEIDPNETPLIRDRWEEFGLGVPLVILESPYRSLKQPVLKYLEEAKKERPDHIITVVLPEFVPKKWWQKALHNQSGIFLKIALMTRKDIVFTNVRHYSQPGEQLREVDERLAAPPPVKSTAIVLVGMIHKGVLPALEYARTLSHDCRALYVEIDPNETPLLRDRWEQFGLGVPLVILESPYRSLIQPVLKYLEEAKSERTDNIVTVVLPEFVPKKWWHKALHNQSGIFLKVALMLKPGIVFTNVRYYLEK